MAIQQGWNQATPAMIATYSRGIGAPGARRRKSGGIAAVKVRAKKVYGRASAKLRKKAKRVGRASRLIKGSAAAKAWGRKMKALRRR